MALEDATQAGFAHGEQERVIQELQGRKKKLVAGAGTAVDIAVAGIALGDTLFFVKRFHISGGNVVSVTDVTGETAITSAGKIQLSTTVTTGDTLEVEWYSKPAAIAP